MTEWPSGYTTDRAGAEASRWAGGICRTKGSSSGLPGRGRHSPKRPWLIQRDCGRDSCLTQSWEEPSCRTKLECLLESMGFCLRVLSQDPVGRCHLRAAQRQSAPPGGPSGRSASPDSAGRIAVCMKFGDHTSKQTGERGERRNRGSLRASVPLKSRRTKARFKGKWRHQAGNRREVLVRGVTQ